MPKKDAVVLQRRAVKRLVVGGDSIAGNQRIVPQKPALHGGALNTYVGERSNTQDRFDVPGFSKRVSEWISLGQHTPNRQANPSQAMRPPFQRNSTDQTW